MFSDKCASRLRVVEHGDNLIHDANRNVGVSRDPFRSDALEQLDLLEKFNLAA